MKLTYGDPAARLVSGRIAEPTATTTTLRAIPIARRVDGMLAIVLADSSAWVFDADSAAGASSTVLVPTEGTGRWLALALTASSAYAGPRAVRGVVAANIANLAAFTVAGNDGLTYAAGQRVLLVNQTTPAECGIYVVGTVGGGTAPLTRADDFAAGAAIVNGSVVEVSEGTLYAGSSWKAMCTGAKVVGTDDPLFYPRTCKGTVTLVAGTVDLGASHGLWLFSATKSNLQLTRNTPNTCTLTVGGYSSAVAGRGAGKIGTAVCPLIAALADGTINVADISTLDWMVTNW